MDGVSSPRRALSCCRNWTCPAQCWCRRMVLENILAQTSLQELEGSCAEKGSGLSNLHRVVEGLENEWEVAGLPSEDEVQTRPPPLQ